MLTSDGHPLAHVGALWRYPVKSMGGESCDELHFETRGVVGDRAFGVLDLTSGTIVSAKRDGRLLYAAAALSSGELLVTLPDGQSFERGKQLDEFLSSWLERPVTIVDAVSFGTPSYECPADYERDDSALESWEGPSGSFVDESPVHLLTTGELEQLAQERPQLQWNVRRFRPNVVIDTTLASPGPLNPGERWHVGEVVVDILNGCSRCVMTTRPQLECPERQLDVLRHVINEHNNVVGVRATAVELGVVRVGDLVTARN